jgi:hypothetical protein
MPASVLAANPPKAPEPSPKRDERTPKANDSARPLVHLHLPKTAGTSIREALVRSGKRVLNINPEFQFDPQRDREVEVFSGHVGFHAASQIGGDIITVLRDPVDRFISAYYHLRQLHASGKEVTNRTILASKYPLEHFADLLDCTFLIEGFTNAVVWQLAYGARAKERMALRLASAPTDDQLVALAVKNLESCSIVGFQDEMEDFCAIAKAKHGVAIELRKANTTKSRDAVDDLPRSVRDKISRWIYLDRELYAHAREAYFKARARR